VRAYSQQGILKQTRGINVRNMLRLPRIVGHKGHPLTHHKRCRACTCSDNLRYVFMIWQRVKRQTERIPSCGKSH